MEQLELDYKFPLLKSLKQDNKIEHEVGKSKKIVKNTAGIAVILLAIPILIFRYNDSANLSSSLTVYAILVAICMPLLQNLLNNISKTNENKKVEMLLEIIAHKIIHSDTDQKNIDMYLDAIQIAKYSVDTDDTSWDIEYQLKKEELEKVIQEKQQELDKLK